MLAFSTWYLLQNLYWQRTAFFLLLHKLRFGKQVLLVTKTLPNLFISNLYSIENIALIFDSFFQFVYLFTDNTRLTFCV